VTRRSVLRELLEIVEDEGGWVRDWRDLPRAVAQLSRDQFSNGLQVGYDEASFERQHCDLNEIRRLLGEADAIMGAMAQALRELDAEVSGRVLD